MTLKLKLKEKGMTLIEVMIVVLIIAFITVITIVYLRSQTLKGNDARRKTDLRKIGIAVEEYEKDHNCYPLPSVVTCSPGTGLVPYLDKIPCDPVSNTNYYYEHEDSACPKWYRLYASLDNNKDPDYIASIGPNSAYSYEQSSSNAPSITSGSGTQQSNFYGCFSGVCTPISWDPNRPPSGGVECDPNFQDSSCYSQCTDTNGIPKNECIPWSN